MANFFPLMRVNPKKQKEIWDGSLAVNLKSPLKPSLWQPKTKHQPQETSRPCKLFHSADSPKCRQLGKKDKTLAHIISRCEMLANSNYLNCHNQIASQIHRALSGKYGFERLEQWWQHKVDTVNWKMKHPKIYGTSTCILTRPFTSAALTCTN